MATIIDSLLVTLGLKADDFHKEKKKVQSGLDDLTKSAAKFLAVIGGTYEIKRFIQNQIEANAALGRLSQNLDESASNIAAWSSAAELAGGSAQGLQGTLTMLSKAQTELQLTGQSALVPYLSALGVSLADVHGHARPVVEVLEEIGQNLMARNGGDRRTAFNMGLMMGIDPGTLNMILQGRQQIELTMKRIRELNGDMDAQAAEATKLRTALFWIQQTFTSLGRSILQDASPMLEKVFQIFQDFADWCRANKQFLEDFFTVMTVGIAAISIAALPITATTVALVALGAALALAWQDYQVWKEGGNSFFTNWAPAIDLATNAFKGMGLVVKSLLFDLGAIGASLMFLAEGDWKSAGQTIRLVGHGSGYAEAKANVDGGSDKQKTLDYFKSQGWTQEQAAGLAANIGAESNFKSWKEGDGGTAYGIGQWHPDRQREFKKKFGKDIQGSTLEEQLVFMQYELTEGNEKFAGDKLRATSNPFDAGVAVSRYYERPDDKTGKVAIDRGNAALAIPWVAAGIPGAAGAAVGAAGGASSPTVINKTSNVTIGDVNLHTQATDGQQAAQDFHKGLSYLFTAQGNAGLR